MNCINEAEKALRPNIQAWINYRDKTLLPFRQELLGEGKEGLRKEFDDAIRKCNDIQVELEKIQQQFNQQRTKALALRDGVSPCAHNSKFG
jgi:hypothetical protein